MLAELPVILGLPAVLILSAVWGGLLAYELRTLLGRRQPALVPVVAPAVGCVVGVLLFVFLAVEVRGAGRPTGADGPVLSWLVTHRRPGLTVAAELLTQLGSPVASVCIAVLAAVLLARAGFGRRSAVFVLAVTAVGGTATFAGKLAVARPRPPAVYELVHETDPSFPSGHVTGTLVLYGAIAIVLLSRVERRAARLSIIAVVAVAVVGTAAVRLYLGVHWLTDVVGAVLLGGSILLAALAVARVALPDDGTTGARRASAAQVAESTLVARSTSSTTPTTTR